MKGLIQRVSHASVEVDGVRIGHIERGLLVFLAAEKTDQAATAKRLCQRITRYRVFPDESGRMNLSVSEAGGSLLVVPQFTLAADTRSGNRPGFSVAAAPDQARSLCRTFTEEAIVSLGAERVAEGRFGADMKVSLTNDGPVTFLLEVAE